VQLRRRLEGCSLRDTTGPMPVPCASQLWHSRQLPRRIVQLRRRLEGVTLRD
jgi:hypothetical protein